MAVVFTSNRRLVVGDRKVAEGELTFTGATSYASNGLALSASTFGLSDLDFVEILGVEGGDALFDHTNSKIKLSASFGGAEIAGSGDPTGVTVLVRAFGHGA